MIDFKELIRVSNEIGDDLVGKVKDSLLNKKKEATGRLINSISSSVLKENDRILINVYAEEYFNYVERGRLPGKFIPINKLQEWMKLKNIPLQYTYPINFNIYKYGIKPTPVLKDILSDIENDVINKIQKSMKVEIDMFITNRFRELKKLK